MKILRTCDLCEWKWEGDSDSPDAGVDEVALHFMENHGVEYVSRTQ